MSPYLPQPTIIVAGVPLAIEFTDGLPDKCDARLEQRDDPRAISVNRNLPQYQQVFGIGRECGFLLQQRGYNSLALDRPWKWKLLAAAPDGDRQKLCHLAQVQLAVAIAIQNRPHLRCTERFPVLVNEHVGHPVLHPKAILTRSIAIKTSRRDDCSPHQLHARAAQAAGVDHAGG